MCPRSGLNVGENLASIPLNEKGACLGKNEKIDVCSMLL